jgi:predicted phosphatase
MLLNGKVNTMLVVKNETPVYFDVDDTLILWQEPSVDSIYKATLNFYGKIVYLYPHLKHIELMKSYRARGFYIIVHSGNGATWANEVVMALGLTEYVDLVIGKPVKIIDNEHPDKWLPKHFFMEYDYENI